MDGMVLKIDRCSARWPRHTDRRVSERLSPALPLVFDPDSQSMEPHLIHTETLCARCGRCVAHCPEKRWILWGPAALPSTIGAVPLRQMRRIVLKNAMKVTGIRMSIDEVYDIINRSRGFWTRMPGG